MKFWYIYFAWFSFVREIVCKELKCRHIEHSYWNKLGNGSLSKVNNGKCVDNKFCKKHYKIQYIDFPPYSDHPTLEPRLKACCGDCVKYTALNQEGQKLRNLSAITETIINESDFIMPVLGSVEKPTMYGLYFIPVCPVPDYLYITPKPAGVFTRMMTKGKVALPLIIACLFMCIIAGFITWAFETCFNEEEFPRPFFRGWWEGIWWSFISITTVGYGDKTPRTVAGRLFAVIWILVGITLFGILTGLLTTAILGANQKEIPLMKNKNVGVLSYRIEDALFVTKHNGKVNRTYAKDFYDDMIQLAALLKDDKIDGIVLDKLTYIIVVNSVYANLTKSGYKTVPKEWREYTKSAMEFLVHKTMKTEKNSNEKPLSYGILVKDKEVFEYFYDAVADNRFVFETSISMDISAVLKEDKNPDIFSFHNRNFKYAVTAMGVATGIIILFGIIFILLSRKYIREEPTIQPANKSSQASFVNKGFNE